MKYKLLIDAATSEENNKNFCKYDTTIDVFIDGIKQDGFISILVGNIKDTDAYYINKAKEFYPSISVTNTKVVRAI